VYLSPLAVRGLRASAGHQIEVSLPGRFAVVLGANSAGKTTVTDAAYLAHGRTFPRLPRPSAAGLGDGDRLVDVEYRFAEDPAGEGPLGRQIQAQSGRHAPGTVAAVWTKSLYRDLGKIATKVLVPSDHIDVFRLVYLPAWRNPVDELARREARILVELLRAQQQNLGKGRNLAGLRARASGLLEALASDELIEALESRIGEHLRALSAGVTRTWPYVRGQVIDDAYLARVLPGVGGQVGELLAHRPGQVLHHIAAGPGAVLDLHTLPRLNGCSVRPGSAILRVNVMAIAAAVTALRCALPNPPI
jgi:putative ATP-dependent endonuclease of the OLD family